MQHKRIENILKEIKNEVAIVRSDLSDQLETIISSFSKEVKNLDNKQCLKEIEDRFTVLRDEVIKLRKEIQYSLNTDHDEHYISLVEISKKYGVSYQGVSKKVYNHIDATKIVKVRNLLSIPKTMVRYLGYKNNGKEE